MCLLGVVYRRWADCPVLVLANREESYSRPSTGPAVRRQTPKATAWLGGLDLQAGGTWLGVNQHGLIVAVTNRPKRHILPNIQSRGILCRDLLECANAEAARDAAVKRLAEHAYAGFNLLALDPRSGFVWEGGDMERVTSLEAGITLIANGTLDDPQDARIAHVRKTLEAQSSADWRDWVESGKRLCGEHGSPGTPDICLHRDGGGTVSSTVLALPIDPSRAEYWYAPGPPCSTPYENFSAQLRELLS